MINYIVGKLVEVNDNIIIVDNNNIGYEIFFPVSNIRNLPEIGNEVKIYIYMSVKEDSITFYGFFTKEDREIFLKLITVNGVGPKGALNIISNFGFNSLVKIIKSSDSKKISEVPGIGQKTASKIIIELSDKIDKIITNSGKNLINDSIDDNDNINIVINDTVEALCTLGYQKKQAVDIIKKLKFDNSITSDELLKLALRK